MDHPGGTFIQESGKKKGNIFTPVTPGPQDSLNRFWCVGLWVFLQFNFRRKTTKDRVFDGKRDRTCLVTPGDHRTCLTCTSLTSITETGRTGAKTLFRSERSVVVRGLIRGRAHHDFGTPDRVVYYKEKEHLLSSRRIRIQKSLRERDLQFRGKRPNLLQIGEAVVC